MKKYAGHQTPILMLSVDKGIELCAEPYQDIVVGGHQAHAARQPHQNEDAHIETNEDEGKRAGSCEERSDEVNGVDALAFCQD
jgi:hypothetical protein